VVTIISIRLLPAARKLSGHPTGVRQTSDCIILYWQNHHIDNWCSYRKYWFIIPRLLPRELLSIESKHRLPINVGNSIGDGEAKWLDNDINRGSQWAIIGIERWLEGSSSSSSVSTHNQEEQKKHRCDEIHTNLHKVSFSIGVSLILFLLWWRPTSTTSSSAASSFWGSRIVFPAMYRFQSGL